MVDHATLYAELRTRVLQVLDGADAAALDRTAPAAPEWQVRDLVAHLTGVCTDIVSGNLNGVGTDAWTAAQVERRRGWSAEQLLTEWSESAPAVAAIIEQIPDLPAWRTFLADAVTHEHDIRGALGQPGARESAAITYIAESATTVLGDHLAERRIGVLRVAFDDEAPTTVGAGTLEADVRLSRFELVRTITGRRSVSQIEAYEWRGQPQPGWLVVGMFTPRTTPLEE